MHLIRGNLYQTFWSQWNAFTAPTHPHMLRAPGVTWFFLRHCGFSNLSSIAFMTLMIGSSKCISYSSGDVSSSLHIWVTYHCFLLTLISFPYMASNIVAFLVVNYLCFGKKCLKFDGSEMAIVRKVHGRLKDALGFFPAGTQRLPCWLGHL